MDDLLAAIVAGSAAAAAHRRTVRPLSDVEREAARHTPRGDVFAARLARGGGPNVIAECKRRSPAKGVLVRDYDPAAIARCYQAGGAAAISVLTEPTFFDGSLAHLEAVRAAVSIPVLRKDFIVDAYQVAEARAAGADAVLLIVAALPGDRLEVLLAHASAMGLAALVEVHTAEELRRAAGSGARLIGVNSRNLKTLDVDRTVFLDLLAILPAGAVAVAESGLDSAEDVHRLHAAGYQAFLIGEWLMRPGGQEARLRALTGGPR